MGNMGSVQYECPYCGCVWMARTQAPGTHTGWSGFLSSAVKNHQYRCQERTPKERVRLALLSDKRRQKHVPKHTEVFNNFNHRGMVDE